MSPAMDSVATPERSSSPAGATLAESWHATVLPGTAEDSDVEQPLAFSRAATTGSKRKAYGVKKQVTFGCALESVSTYMLDEDLDVGSSFTRGSGEDVPDSLAGSIGALHLPKAAALPGRAWDLAGETVAEDREKPGNAACLPDVLATDVGLIKKLRGDLGGTRVDLGSTFAAAAVSTGAPPGSEAAAPRRFSHRRTRSCPWQL
uniref:Uncharacterized protein n=1 Tax=Alexandrium catenella TaxID=2925 RepID=A0A7S1SFV4_ALECA